ncbi:hypothetical protein H4R34_002055 [Dimargaris verticillata]|uniref:Secreted protein n=1 Tax=Dimargaris verticillata TaxID=2761393 RepID=A0A9W8EEF7_9FUNG|nr:hypothetical protein H4R34_002055 [Dimargaris verticillata]
MVRITLWFLATMAAVSLINARPMTGDDSEGTEVRHLKHLFTDIRKRLELPDIMWAPENIKVLPEGVKELPEGIKELLERVAVLPEDIRGLPERITECLYYLKGQPEDLDNLPDHVKQILEDIEELPEGDMKLLEGSEENSGTITVFPESIRSLLRDIKDLSEIEKRLLEDIGDLPRGVRMLLEDTERLPHLIGLRTLLDGAQLEFRAMARSVLKYIAAHHSGSKNERTDHERNYPDVYLKFPFPENDIPSLVSSWANANFGLDMIPTSNVNHGLVKLGRDSGIDQLFDVIDAFFDVLNSRHLLNNFMVIVMQVMREERSSQAQLVPGRVQPEEFPVFLHWFWLVYIGGGNAQQLRYFLHNLLTFTVIPHILGEVLASGKHIMALDLVERINELPGFKKFVAACQTNAPNYFEFIAMYATEQQLHGLETLMSDRRIVKYANIPLLYHCFETDNAESPWAPAEGRFRPQLPADVEWSDADNSQCQPLREKYTRGFKFTFPHPIPHQTTPLMRAFSIIDEDTSDIFVPTVPVEPIDL